MLVHGWDIAKGSGQDAVLNPGLMTECLPIAEQITREFRSGGWYGEELQVPPDADVQTRLLALFGRAPIWAPPRARPRLTIQA